MKVIPIALQDHYGSGATSVAHAIAIKREDGSLFGFTSNDVAFSCSVPYGFGMIAFDAKQGLDATTIVSTAGFAVDNLEMTTLDDGTLFERDDILAGAWKNAEFLLFRYRWGLSTVSYASDCETLVRGWFGETTVNDSTIRVELRGLKQLLQQPVGEASSKTCRNRLGDRRCKVDLDGYTYACEVTSIADKRTFTATISGTVADDFFGEGIVEWLSGDNAGLSSKVRLFSSSGSAFTLQLPSPFEIQAGDTFNAIAGCRKRLMEDCKSKFSNVLHFRGEPHRPTLDDLVTK